MKHISRSLILAMILALLLAAFAAAEGLSLFDLFGRREARYAAVAPRSSLSFSEAALVEHPELGKAEAAIENAYFDGLSLSLAYRISSGQKTEVYAPTAEEISAMQKGSAAILGIDPVIGDPDAEILLNWNRAVATGTPYGMRRLTVYTSDHTVTDDGIDIAPDTSLALYDEAGAFCDLREYECPLPPELKDRETLRVNIAVYQEEAIFWFDGTDAYWTSSREKVGAMAAEIPQNGQTRVLTGEGEIGGVKCSARAEAGALATVVTLKSEAPINTFLPQPPAGTDPMDVWVELIAVDQTGCAYQPKNGGFLDDSCELTAVLDGSGELPETLALSLNVFWEGEAEAAKTGDSLLLAAKD